MRDVTTANFGLLIAYVVPGLIVLFGVEPCFPMVSEWFHGTSVDGPTVGGFLFVTVVAVGLGQIVSTTRWMLLDSIHHLTGVRKPRLRFDRLGESVLALEQLIEMHYRHYQWHGNALIAINACWALRSYHHGMSKTGVLAVIAVDMILFAGSRDTLQKYYRRAEELLNGGR